MHFGAIGSVPAALVDSWPIHSDASVWDRAPPPNLHLAVASAEPIGWLVDSGVSRRQDGFLHEFLISYTGETNRFGIPSLVRGGSLAGACPLKLRVSVGTTCNELKNESRSPRAH